MTETLQLGRPAGRWYPIGRMARRGYSRTADAGAGVRRLLGGSYAVDRAARECRTWQLDWAWMSDAERRHLHALHSRQYGPGPWVLLDPACRNYATPNQAGATSAERAATGFTVAGGETLASSSTFAVRGDRSLRWSLPASVSSGILTLDGSPGLSAVATPEGQAWAFGLSARVAGSDTSVELRLALQWLDASLVQVSETLGTPVTLGSAGWSALSAVGSCPAGAVWWRPRPKVTAGTVSATCDVYLDEIRLHLGSAVGPWMPGEGQPLVSFANLNESVPFVERRDLAATLYEVG